MQFNTSMVRSYVKIAIRNISKRKFYSFINAFGLSIGIAFCILVYLFIQDEKSFDQFHENKDLIYRIHAVNFDYDNLEKSDFPYKYSANLPAKLGEVMLDELAGVNYMTRFMPGNGTVQYQDKIFKETGLVYVDSSFFDMFSFPLLAGSGKDLFRKNSDVVITADLAKKYFGNEDPIGKSFTLKNAEHPYTVAAVIAAPPSASSLQFTMLLPITSSSWLAFAKERWSINPSSLFIQVMPDTDAGILKTNLNKLTDKYLSETNKQKRERYKIPNEFSIQEFDLVKLADIHFANHISWEKVSDKKYSWILGGIALLILIIAAINYISLALTSSAGRRVEIGIRKITGAQRNQLVAQFGFESIILSLLSLCFGICLAILFLPAFNSFTAKSIDITIHTLKSLVFAGMGVTIMVGIVAGSYPAIFLSGLLPTAILKGKSTSKFRAGFVKPLVVIQFFLSAFLIISAVIMLNQMKFIASKNLGYNGEQIIAVESGVSFDKSSVEILERFKNALQNNSKVLGVTGTVSAFGGNAPDMNYKFEGNDKSVSFYRVDYAYIPLLEIEIIAGRNFDPNIGSDQKAIIVNEALVKDLEWKDPLNEHLNWKMDDADPGYKVIGVVKDYHFLSLEKKIEPMLLTVDGSLAGLETFLVKISPDGIPENLESIRQTWMNLFPDKPFMYSFVEDNIKQQYKNYDRWTNIATLATTFAIIIACLGLFGLSGLSTINRTKEIGIRKVLGAKIGNIFILLNREYIGLAAIAFVLAIPVAWFSMNQWLESFYYKIELGLGLFLISMALSLGIALLTVSYHGIKAALINPADTLRHE